MARLLLGLLLAVGLTDHAFAQLAISAVTPSAVAPGKTTEITLAGPNLADPLAVWTSFPAQVELLPVEPNQRKLKFTLAETVPVGVGGIVVANAAGVSAPLMLMIDDLPSIAETANNTAATAQEITPPVAIDGTGNGPQFDYYRLSLAQGQRIALEVVAARRGSDFDAVLRVLDANGRELAMADDDEGLGADARLVFTAPAAGPYTIELRDNRYKAGGQYRLRIGDFPLVTVPFPAGGKAGDSLTTSLVARDGEAIPATMQLPATPFDSLLSVSAKRSGGSAAGFATLRTSDLPSALEIDPSASSKEGQPIAASMVVHGRLLTAKQRDRYTFAARKGERWNFQATSRSFGSPVVASLRVLNAADAQVAASTPTEAEEELLAFTAPEDGNYRLEVEDLLGRGGPTYVYCIEVTQGPLFNLVLKNDANTKFSHLMAPGGGQFADVQVQRSGYDGPIELSPLAARAGFRLHPSKIPDKVNELRIYLLPPADYHAGELVDLRIVAKANVGPRVHQAVAHNRLQLKTARPLLPHPPSWQEGAIFIGHADQAAFYTLAPAMAELPLALGAAAMVPFAFERTDMNFKDAPLALTFSGLPAGVTAEVKRNGNGPKESYEVTFKAAATSPEGKHAVHWFGYAEFGGRGRVIEGDLQLVLNKPAQ